MSNVSQKGSLELPISKSSSKVRRAFDRKVVALEFVNDCPRTAVHVQQSFAVDSDINTIVSRFQKLGQTFQEDHNPANYIDVSSIPDYQVSLNHVIQTQELFDSLPAKVRREFQDDPSQLIAFVSDEKNRDRAIELGLIEKPKENLVSVPPVEGSDKV